MSHLRTVSCITAIWGICSLATTLQAQPLSIDYAPGKPVAVKAEHEAHELSGITYTGGNQYFAVGDDTTKRFYELEIKLRSNGSIQSARVVKAIDAKLSYDCEDITFHPKSSHLFICAESDHSVKEYTLTGGEPIRTVNTIPPIYRKARLNLSLESLSYGNGSFWICNEEALLPDGPTSRQLKAANSSGGTIIRLQQFDDNFKPVAQYAYEVEPVTNLFDKNDRIFKRLAGMEVSGVSALLVLPNGQVLALERSLGKHGIASFRNIIYLIDTENATDISSIPSLKNATAKKAGKTKLWEAFFLIDNYEGMCLGPKLNDGSYAIILISDDGGKNGHNGQNVISLKLKGLVE